MADFPANNWLGYGIDMTTATPFDVVAVANSVKQSLQIIQVDTDETRLVTIGGIVYQVPKLIAVATDIKALDGEYVTYSTGTQATTSFEADTSLSARYLAVSGGISTDYALSKSFRSDEQFALYSFNGSQYIASLRNYIDFINETSLKSRLKDLASPFPDAPSKDVIQGYKDFFEVFGSHVITNTTYGSRFQLNVWASNSSSEVNENFSVNVTAAFGGINANGKFDSSVKNESQYKTFSAFMDKSLSVQGGDTTLAVSLLNDPTKYDNYTEWVKTSLTNPNVMNFETTPLWSIVSNAANHDVRKRANDIQNAFDYITSHPQLYKTAVTLSIESDWAEFGLLTPSALLIANPDIPFPENTVASQTKVTWGTEYKHTSKRATVELFIINDGSPTDFYISHGSDGSKGGNGRASISMEANTYTNDKLTDNNFNTMWFYQAKVSSVPDEHNLSNNHEKRTWNDILRGYLKERGLEL